MGIIMLERLIDSVILIDHLNGIEKATQFILSLIPENTAISVQFFPIEQVCHLNCSCESVWVGG